MNRRLAAFATILGFGVALATAIYSLLAYFPRGLVILACVGAAIIIAWFGLLRRGGARIFAITAAALLVGLAIGILISGAHPLELALVGAGFAIGMIGASAAFSVKSVLAAAAPPRQAVLFVNPRSGDGKAGRLNLVGEAAKRGLQTVELAPGEDLGVLVSEAIAAGADALAMAGGDGSQAIVAAIAAEHDLPYACIPSGTRNHFALDLGVDRDDVIGALDALIKGGERIVDLAEVNGRIFVNNVSLGVYAEAVSQERYREAKLQTLLDTIPEVLGPDRVARELRWTDPDGVPQRSTAMMLISNNAYLLGPRFGSGTRPRLDSGLLGVVDFRPPAGVDRTSVGSWRELQMAALQIEADQPVPSGIDGESVILQPPLRFRSRAAALRVRIAPQHPGASPSSALPKGAWEALLALLAIAFGRSSSNAR
jgi:diacylglycerol kinase family enzyme